MACSYNGSTVDSQSTSRGSIPLQATGNTVIAWVRIPMVAYTLGRGFGKSIAHNVSYSFLKADHASCKVYFVCMAGSYRFKARSEASANKLTAHRYQVLRHRELSMIL